VAGPTVRSCAAAGTWFFVGVRHQRRRIEFDDDQESRDACRNLSADCDGNVGESVGIAANHAEGRPMRAAGPPAGPGTVPVPQELIGHGMKPAGPLMWILFGNAFIRGRPSWPRQDRTPNSHIAVRSDLAESPEIRTERLRAAPSFAGSHRSCLPDAHGQPPSCTLIIFLCTFRSDVVQVVFEEPPTLCSESAAAEFSPCNTSCSSSTEHANNSEVAARRGRACGELQSCRLLAHT